MIIKCAYSRRRRNPDVDVWTYFRQEAVPAGALPVGVILTLSAQAVEMSASCVITNEENVDLSGL